MLPGERKQVAPAVPQSDLQTAVLEPAMFTREPVNVESSPVITPVSLPEDFSLPEANTDKPQSESVSVVPARQPWKMEPIALPPDMEMIETQADMSARMLEEERQDVSPPARRPRQHFPEPIIPDEPLQQVETRKE